MARREPAGRRRDSGFWRMSQGAPEPLGNWQARWLYYNRLESGVIFLLVIYAKAVRGAIPANILKAIKEEIDHVQG